MSANRSWDIRPNTKKQVRLHADPALVRGGKKTVPSVPLKTRRRKYRRFVLAIMLVLLAMLLCAGGWAMWQPALRVQSVSAGGIHAEEMKTLAAEALSGTYYFIIPKDSILFLPKEEIRERILDAHPDVSAVSVKRSGFDSITVSSVARTPAFVWCGVSIESEASGTGLCYEADALGLLFAPVHPTEPAIASSTPSVSGRLSVYAPLTEATPLRAHVANAAIIPDVLRLQRGLASLGASIEKIQIRGDEADFYTVGGTRITYVIGDEINAGALAASAFPSLNLNDGSIQYVDLRFSGKVYLKREGEAETE